eukprot:scaffold4387_cov126-Isochrysis_galbana.AAC.8
MISRFPAQHGGTQPRHLLRDIAAILNRRAAHHCSTMHQPKRLTKRMMGLWWHESPDSARARWGSTARESIPSIVFGTASRTQ